MILSNQEIRKFYQEEGKYENVRKALVSAFGSVSYEIKGYSKTFEYPEIHQYLLVENEGKCYNFVAVKTKNEKYILKDVVDVIIDRFTK